VGVKVPPPTPPLLPLGLVEGEKEGEKVGGASVPLTLPVPGLVSVKEKVGVSREEGEGLEVGWEEAVEFPEGERLGEGEVEGVWVGVWVREWAGEGVKLPLPVRCVPEGVNVGGAEPVGVMDPVALRVKGEEGEGESVGRVLPLPLPLPPPGVAVGGAGDPLAPPLPLPHWVGVRVGNLEGVEAGEMVPNTPPPPAAPPPPPLGVCVVEGQGDTEGERVARVGVEPGLTLKLPEVDPPSGVEVREGAVEEDPPPSLFPPPPLLVVGAPLEVTEAVKDPECVDCEEVVGECEVVAVPLEAGVRVGKEEGEEGGEEEGLRVEKSLAPPAPAAAPPALAVAPPGISESEGGLEGVEPVVVLGVESAVGVDMAEVEGWAVVEALRLAWEYVALVDREDSGVVLGNWGVPVVVACAERVAWLESLGGGD
jgi:hypothetical protein